jgi:general secretion pathway protein J
MKRRGFTLLELLVAMAIFSIIVSACYALFSATRGAARRAEFKAQMLQTARAALGALEDELRAAVMPASGFDTGFIGTNSGSEKQPLDRLEFVTASGHPAGLDKDNYDEPDRLPERSDLVQVRYWIEEDLSRKAHGLVRERHFDLLPVSTRTLREEDVEEVAPEVVHVNLRYYDTEWRDSWDTTQTRKMPKAVEITVHVRGEWNDEEVFETFTSRVYLPVAAETPERQQP